jgi:putative ABC transport system permease protein
MLLSELRQAIRTLMRPQNAGFTWASVLMLGLGIAAITSIFSVLYAVMLAPLPFKQEASLFAIAESKPAAGMDVFSVSGANYLDWTERAHGYAGIAAYGDISANLGIDGRVERVEGMAVTSNLWEVIGLPLLLGRTFSADEDHVVGAAVIVGERMWRQRFNADPDVLGRRVMIDGTPRTVIGVAAQDAGIRRHADLWLPLGLKEQPWGRGDRRLEAVGVLAPGVSRASADEELRVIAAQLGTEFPDDNRDWTTLSVPVRDWIVGAPLKARVWMLFGAVILLLLVVCINVANLQIARASTRMREIGVRQALGGTRGRLMRQIVGECTVIAGLGGLIGIGVGALAIELASAQWAAALPGIGALDVNWQVALVALGVTAVTALVCGLVPAHLAARSQIASTLRSGGRASTEQQRSPLRQALIVLQFALATLLVAASALLVQQFQAIQASTLGFEPTHVLTARITLPDDDNGTHYAENYTAYDQLLAELRTLPGVERAGLGSEVPLGQMNTTSMNIAAGTSVSDARTTGHLAAWRVVTADFLDALSVPLLRGRSFGGSEESGSSMLLSAGLVRQLWPAGEDPLGRSVTLSNGRTYQVVGVVGDVRQRDRAGAITPTMYMSTSWAMLPTMTLALRTHGDPAALIAEVRAAAERVLPDRPLFNLSTLDSIAAANVAEPRAQTAVVSLFGAISLLLAAIGVAGVTAFLVARRTPELAVRMALGASTPSIVSFVVGHGSVLCIGGVAIGAVLVVALSKVAGSVLQTPDVSIAPTILGVAVALIGVGLLASWIPALRATRISPTLALRGE